MSQDIVLLRRWNVNPEWEHFSSLVRESWAASHAGSEIHRYHHLRAALYFGIGTLEALLNRMMRGHAKATGVPAEKLDELLWKGFPAKLRHWPKTISGETPELPPELVDQILEFNQLRGEITHEKALDHELYSELDRLDPVALTDAVREYAIRLICAGRDAYPYWLHGWNFIGMAGDPRWPVLMANQQFIMALRHVGLDGPGSMAVELDAWEKRHMRSLAGFSEVENMLARANCQPRDERFPFMPRLCKRWWSDAHVTRCGTQRPLPLPRLAPPT